MANHKKTTFSKAAKTDTKHTENMYRYLYIRATVEIENKMSKTTSPPPPFVKAVTEIWGSVKFHVKNIKRAEQHTVLFFRNGLEPISFPSVTGHVLMWFYRVL